MDMTIFTDFPLRYFTLTAAAEYQRLSSPAAFRRAPERSACMACKLHAFPERGIERRSIREHP